MNIAILDYTLSKTHIRFNIANFEQLRKLANLYIVNCEGYYDEFAKQYDNVHLFDPGIVIPTTPINSLKARALIINRMKRNAQIFSEYKDVHFDVIIIMGFEVITFSLYRAFVPKNIPIYIFQHQQLDEIENPIKRLFFNTYKNNVQHIVLEEFFKEFIENEYNVKKVHVVHYVTYVNEGKIHHASHDDENNFILAISGHNDEKIVGDIIRAQRECKFLTSNNVKMYIRSFEHSYQDDYLFVGYEYLSADKYDELFTKAKAILALIPEYFHNRVSGPVFDGVSSGKVILCSNKSVYDAYVEKAGSIIRYFSNLDELISILMEKKWNVDFDEIAMLQKQYSPEGIYMEYKSFLEQKK